MAAVTRQERIVAYVLGASTLAALLETAGILGDPAACKAIADAEAGKGHTYSLADLDE